MRDLWDVDAFTGTSAQALNLADAYERWAYEPWHDTEAFWAIAQRYRVKAAVLAAHEHHRANLNPLGLPWGCIL